MVMTHLKTWMATLLLACAPALLLAATPAPDHFAATFVETRTLPGFKQALTSHGLLRFSRDGGFHWEITQPYHYVFEMADGNAHEVLPDGTRRVLKPEQTPWLKAVQRIFVSALSGDRAQLARYFNVQIEPLDDGRQVTLTPKPGAMAKVIKRIEVTESAPGHPRHLVIEQASGGHMDIRFTPIDRADGPA
ncbi:MAG TPA: outer membrane lipoprotein carrier protein LolA [Oleiagrimonas sp.]|nr:outer membrane lipoprotein carrier protein LolA [Oleiagrimonas sp.]